MGLRSDVLTLARVSHNPCLFSWSITRVNCYLRQDVKKLVLDSWSSTIAYCSVNNNWKLCMSNLYANLDMFYNDWNSVCGGRRQIESIGPVCCRNFKEYWGQPGLNFLLTRLNNSCVRDFKTDAFYLYKTVSVTHSSSMYSLNSSIWIQRCK